MGKLRIISIFLTFSSLSKGSVLSPDLHFLNLDTDAEGKEVYTRWNPSQDEINHANNQLAEDVRRHVGPKLEARADYIDLHRNLSWSRALSLSKSNAVVELVIVCDKEFSDVFGGNNQAILDYLAVYFWDINSRYKSLPSDNISFRVNGIINIRSKGNQPFIEQARASDGRAEFGRILDRYKKWVYQQMKSWPAFDLAPLITNAQQEWGGGLAHMNAACWIDNGGGNHLGTAVWNDNGGWGSLTVAAHELGHNLGAPHDDDANYPGGCSERGFIMGGGNDDLRYFFSSCRDRTISSFVRSNGASCLRTISGGSPAIDVEFSKPNAPNMADHCKRTLNDNTAWIEQKDTNNCKVMRCLKNDKNNPGTIWIYSIAPVENVQCGNGGRCFRGRCRQGGHFFKNLGSGLCMRASDAFTHMAPAEMFPCPNYGTPLDRLLVGNQSYGTTLASPFTSDGNN